MPKHIQGGPSFDKNIKVISADEAREEARARLKGARPKIGGPKTLRTKIPIERPAGRPSAVESIMLNELIRNAAVLKGWLIVNNRVATGTAVNSIRVKVARSKLARSAVSDRVNVGGIRSTSDDPTLKLGRIAALARATDVGVVRGQILGVPHLKFALQGRGSGTPPATSDILAWMRAKGVGLSDTKMSLSQQAFFIAQSIGRKGTAPPHFSENIRTSMVRISAKKLVTNIARIFPSWEGNKYVETLVALGTLYDNLDIRRVTKSQQQFEEFI